MTDPEDIHNLSFVVCRRDGGIFAVLYLHAVTLKNINNVMCEWYNLT